MSRRPAVLLASGSPQRREILQRLGIEFEVAVPGVDELTEGDPAEVVAENALRKARAVARPGRLVVGCDTDVVLDGRVVGKPAGEGEAARYLRALSGREHEVLSGLAVIRPEGEERSGLARSVVAFRELDDERISAYVASGEWRGRAGGYAIQARGSALVAGVDGDVSNVIGLPVGLLLELAPELN